MVTTNPFDGWRVATGIDSPSHVHAFGMVAMNAAMMEEALTLLLAHFMGLPHDIAIPLIHKMAVGDRTHLVKKIAEAREEELADLSEHLEFAVKCFDICIQNRNILVHAVYVKVDEMSQTVTVSKRSRKNPAREFKLNLHLSDLRRSAEEIANTVNYLLDLWFILSHGRGTNTLLRKPSLPHSLGSPQNP